MTSSISPRRSSRRGEYYSLSPNFGLSKDETAFSVLRQYVLEDDFKPTSDPDNVMKKIWIRYGKEKNDDNDGVDWIKEDGFTVKKYEEFWRKEMAELDDVIVEWGHKLPVEAKAHLDKSLFKDDDINDAIKVDKAAKVSPASGKENERKITNSRKTKKRRGRPPSASNDDEDKDSGLTPELVGLRRKWFQQLEAGQYKVGSEEVKKTTSIKKMKAQAESTKNLFLHNVAGCPKVAQYKQVALDPLAKHIIANVDAHVANYAAALRNEFLEDLVLANYKFTEEDKVNAIDGTRSNDEN